MLEKKSTTFFSPDSKFKIHSAQGTNLRVYLSPYSPELNSITQLWAVVNRKVRRSQFGNTEDLKTRIAEACDQVPRKHLHNFAQHSVRVFEDCLNELPI